MPKSNLLSVTEANFEHEVRRSTFPVLIEVSAPWCPPCRAAAPIMRELAERYRGSLKVVEVDGEESPELVARLGVRGFPTFVAVVGGQIVKTLAGFSGRSALEKLALSLTARAAP